MRCDWDHESMWAAPYGDDALAESVEREYVEADDRADCLVQVSEGCEQVQRREPP
jgi:hypothetical protein